MKSRSILLPIVAAFIASCTVRLDDYRAYSGDGTFVPHPAPTWVCQDGYSVDLGTIDLSSPGTVTRQLAGLPRMTAVIGLQLDYRSAAPRTSAPPPIPTAVVEVSVRDEHDRSVLSRQERLSAWSASIDPADPARVYLFRRPPTWEVPQPSGAVRVEPINVGADDGSGSYFKPRRDGRYTLHFTVSEPDPNLAGFDVRLRVDGVAACL